jgi:hypothetical protein
VHVQKLCDAAGVPRVSTHSLRGLHSTLALEAGATASAVAAALGHASFAVTARHYAAPDTLHNLRARRAQTSLKAPQEEKPEAHGAELPAPVAEALKTLQSLLPQELAQLRAVLTKLDTRRRGRGPISS